MRLSHHARDFARTVLAPFFATDLALVDAYFGLPAGVARNNRLFTRLLAGLEGLQVRSVRPGRAYPLSLGSVAATLWLANARDLTRFRAKVPWLAQHSGFNLGYWYFELEELPPGEAVAEEHLDEIWTASRFVGATVERSCTTPVHVIPPPVLLEGPGEPAGGPVAGAKADRFLVQLDAYSSVERKNPWAAIDAFEAVFRHDPVKTLTVRVSRPEGLPEDLRRRLLDRRSARVKILLETFPRGSDAQRFLHSHDVYLSPHRSEGLGLNLVEAVLAGMPVIATGYGGNVDFCDPAGVDLLEYELIPGHDPQGLYTGTFRWADPKHDHFCACLEALASRSAEEHQERRRAARQAVLQHFETERIRDLLEERLAGIFRREAA